MKIGNISNKDKGASTIGIGINAGSISAPVVVVNQVDKNYSEWKRKIIATDNLYLLRKIAFLSSIYNPTGIITSRGGQLSHLNALFSGSGIKVAMGIHKEFVRNLAPNEEVSIIIDYNNNAFVNKGSATDENLKIHYDNNLIFKEPIYATVWSSRLAQSVRLPNISGIGLIRTETLLEYIYYLTYLTDLHLRDSSEQQVWHQLPSEFINSNERFQNAVEREFEEILSLFADTIIKLRLPDWQSSQGGTRGIQRLLSNEFKQFNTTFLQMLTRFQKKHSNLEIILPFVHNHNDWHSAKNMLLEIGWHEKISAMIESPEILQSPDVIAHLKADGIMIGMSDLTSIYLNISRDLPCALFPNRNFNKIIPLINNFLRTCNSQKIPCIIGGLQSSWLIKLENLLTFKPTGWFLRPDPEQISHISSNTR